MMPFSKKVALGLFTISLVSLLGCSPCSESPGARASSPDKALSAVTTYRNCGATTSEYTRITLTPGPGNDRDVEQLIFMARYHQEISLQWSSPSDLTISCSTCSSKDVEFQIVKFRSTKVAYILGPSGAGGD